MAKKYQALFEELSYYLDQLVRMWEVEDMLAEWKGPTALHPGLKTILIDVNRRIERLVRDILGSAVHLGAAGPHIPLEVLENTFQKLRDVAELAWVRSMKATGRDAKRIRAEAETYFQFALKSAEVLKAEAVRKGAWNDKYRDDLGLKSWVE